MKVAVVYLARGIVYSIEETKRFYNSYYEHPAGFEHELIFIKKGWEKNPDEKEFDDYTEQNSIKTVQIPDDGLDLGAFFRISRKIDADYFLFIGTNSKILCDDWLLKFVNAVKNDEEIIMAGAVGSWESPFFHLVQQFNELKNSKMKMFKKFRRMLKFFVGLLFIDWRRYSVPFPNYHLNTSAFFIEANFFKKYAEGVKFPKTKMDTYFIEHGWNSLSKSVLKNHKKVVVVDSKGKVWPPEKWNESHTFRHKDANNNAIVYIKRAKLYDEASDEEKRKLEELAWGKHY